MSQGRRLIQAVIRDEQPGALRLLGDRFFLEEEIPLYEFVNGHHARYGRLPDVAVLVENGFRMPELEGDQPVSYHLDRIRERFVFNTVNGALPTITGGMTAQDMEAVTDAFRETLATIGAAAQGNTATLLSDEAQEVYRDYQIARSTVGLRGLTFGWPGVDTITLGAQQGDLIVVAARPAMGKTNTLINMAYAGWECGGRQLVISMEMTKLQLARRWVGRHTGINPNFIRAGELSPWGQDVLRRGIVEIGEATGRVYLESGDFARSVGGIEAMILHFNPEVVYIDAAYLLSPDGQKRGFVSRWEQLSAVVGQLKQLALRYQIPVFITVQFNRNQKSNTDKVPDLGDIAGTDSIPQDASIVFGLQKAPSPYEEVRRVARMMKSREGEVKDTLFNYRFSPVDFSEIPFEEQQSQRQATVNLEWMV